MPSFMPIGPKLWALKGYIHTDRQTHRETVLLLLYRLALRGTSCNFKLALRGYSVASLPRNFQKKSVSQSTQNGLKRIKMQKKKKIYPFDALCAQRSERRSATTTSTVALLNQALRFALALLGRFAPSGFALRARYLPHVTPKVPRSVHAKFHADWSKTVGAGGIHTHTQTVLLLLYR